MTGKRQTGYPVSTIDVAGDKQEPLFVYYDGECPVCRLEVGFYRGIDTTGRIAWIDINGLADGELPAGRSRERLLGVFHARTGEAEWATGVDAFGAIWSRLPGFRHLAWVFRVPVLRQLAKASYFLFLAWQQGHRERRLRRLRDREESHAVGH